MKFHKFRELAAKDPWLLDIVDPLCTLRTDQKTHVSVPERIAKVRETVRGKIDYIAFCTGVLPDMDAPQGIRSVYTSEDHADYDDELSFPYEKDFWSVVCRDGKGPLQVENHWGGNALRHTIRQILAGGEASFEFLVKRTVKCPHPEAPEKMAIEIYTLPPWGIPECLKTQESKPVSDYERLRAAAYASGTEMPPIIPGALF